MLVELTILPIGHSPHTAVELAGVLQLIEASGLPFQLTPSATCLEGPWPKVMAVVEQCHAYARQRSSHVVTLVKIEDEAGVDNILTSNVASIERKVGHCLSRPTPAVTELPL